VRVGVGVGVGIEFEVGVGLEQGYRSLIEVEINK